MTAGIFFRIRLYSALNVLGWVVVMPALVIAAMSPFVDFHAWPDAIADRGNGTQVALLPPRLSVHGSLPPLTEKPQPSAAVPVHRELADTFTPAAAPAGSSSATGSRRATRRSAAPRGSARSRGPVRPPASTRGARGPARVAGPAAPVTAPEAAPGRPGEASNRPEPSQDPQPGKGNGKPEDPQHGQAGKPAPAPAQNGKSDDPQHGQAGKQDQARQGGGGDARTSDDPQHGQAGRQDDPQRGRGGG